MLLLPSHLVVGVTGFKGLNAFNILLLTPVCIDYSFSVQIFTLFLPVCSTDLNVVALVLLVGFVYAQFTLDIFSFT